MRMRLIAGIWGAFAIISAAWAAPLPNPGDEVVVVYNTKSPGSKQVAEHYAAVRRVPAKQVLGLPLSVEETVTRAAFRETIEEPLFERFTATKWFEIGKDPKAATPVKSSAIRYLVLCHGVPLKIGPDAELKEADIEKLQPELRRNEAAIDSELAFLSLAGQKRTLAGPGSNPVYGQTNRFLINPTNNLLMVARLDGPTAEIALRLVDKAVQAETNGFWGRAYFDVRGLTNSTYKAGDDSLRAGAAVARRLGFETVLDEAPETFSSSFPISHVALYAGWYDGHVSGPFAREKVEFMPGAFAYHLHSFNAETIRSATTHWVGPLLAKGATITFGTVYEPYLAGTPHIGLFLERLIWNRFSYGEAIYASQPVLSWQTTVVGDPLYTPFHERPDVLHQRLEQRKSPELEWSHLRVVNLNQATSASSIEELMGYLDQISLTKTSAILQEKVGDLYRDNKRFSAAAFAYAKAAKLDPSPQQRIRLLLTVGELQTLLAREQEAYDAYASLVTQAPDYPNIAQIYARLIPLARTLGKTNEMEKFEAEFKKLSAPATK